MRNVICNENTVAIAKKEAWLAFRECYLSIQHCLLTFLKEAKTEEEKNKIREQIKEAGESYQNATSAPVVCNFPLPQRMSSGILKASTMRM